MLLGLRWFKVTKSASCVPKDLAPKALEASEGMMKMLFRQHFVRTDSSKGLDTASANLLIDLLTAED